MRNFDENDNNLLPGSKTTSSSFEAFFEDGKSLFIIPVYHNNKQKAVSVETIYIYIFYTICKQTNQR